MNPIQTIKTLIAGLFLVLFTTSSNGQEKFSISTGLGYPELLNLGLRYQFGQSQLGLSAGFFPDQYDDYFSVGADYYYHFGALSKLSERRTWYGRLGLYHYAADNEYESWGYLFLVPRIGKDFNLAPKWGIAADAGLAIVLSRQEEDNYVGRGLQNDMALSIGFSIFYRL